MPSAWNIPSTDHSQSVHPDYCLVRQICPRAHYARVWGSRSTAPPIAKLKVGRGE